MKKVLIILMFTTLTISRSNAQQQIQTILAKFIITDARINQRDVTQYYTNNESYFAFYTLPNDTTLYFASVMTKAMTQSYGRTYNMHTYSTPQTETSYEIDHFEFSWSYSNSYDQHKGTTTMKLLKTSKANGVAFELTMIAENLDVFEYKGYMEGTLNLQFNK